MDLLERLVLVHWQRNVPALGTWFEKILDESKPLLSWDQLLEEVSWEQILRELEREEPQGRGRRGRRVQRPSTSQFFLCFF